MTTRVASRLRLEIRGQVQGVGFRPFIYRLANSLNLTGWIYNDGDGVVIEIQGDELDVFVQKSQQKLPQNAYIDELTQTNIPLSKEIDPFYIKENEAKEGLAQPAVDTQICSSCLEELFDPQSRFYHYPFISCLDCGPRYTITKDLPYDRTNTSLAPFSLCSTCQIEFSDVDNKRFHCQTITCPKCGPRYDSDLNIIARAIRNGKIVALKSMGGYQLICEAKKESAIHRLRKVKNRSHKPFAIMVKNTISAKNYVKINEAEVELLQSKAAPIVLLHKKPSVLPHNIAPELKTLGVMLAYSAMHYLLFSILESSTDKNFDPDEASDTVLIVTSANLSGDAIISDDKMAQEKLRNIADLIVSHDYDIITAVDDSVSRVYDGQPYCLRQGRGYTPNIIKLKNKYPNILALGAAQKNTISIIRDNQAMTFQHIGDLDTVDSIQHFHNVLTHLKRILHFSPDIVVSDKHPDFYSTHYAQTLSDTNDIPFYQIQHHQAHLLACACELAITEPYIGLCLDGFGYGEDGEHWGGEVFYADGIQFQHLGQLDNIKLVGGDKASRQPWRVATALLWDCGLSDLALEKYGDFKVRSVIECLDKNIACIASSSAGRLFDGFAALAGICLEPAYEAEAAMKLEHSVQQPKVIESGYKISKNCLSLKPLVQQITDQDKQTIADYFHGTFAFALSLWLQSFCLEYNTRHIVLSGGCWQNAILLDQVIKNLSNSNLQVHIAQKPPINDGGISLGQAYFAALATQN